MNILAFLGIGITTTILIASIFYMSISSSSLSILTGFISAILDCMFIMLFIASTIVTNPPKE